MSSEKYFYLYLFFILILKLLYSNTDDLGLRLGSHCLPAEMSSHPHQDFSLDKSISPTNVST